MAIEVDLQTAGQPSGHTDIGQTQFFVDEVKVVVPTSPLVRPEISLAALLVMPWLVGGTRFHGGKDGYQSGMAPAFGQHHFHQILFAYLPLADMFNLHPVLFCQPFGVLAQFLAQRLGKARVVEDPHRMAVQVRGRPLGETNAGQSAKHQNAVVARPDAGYLIRISFGEERPSHSGIIMDACLVPALPG